MPQRQKRLLLAAALAGLFSLGGGLAVYHGQADAAPAAAAPTATVDVAAVASRAVTEWQQYSGRLEAVERVEIHPQVSGILTAVHFKDGSLVRKGDLLFTIDPRPFAAEVARAEAQLAAMDARVAYTASDLARSERLLAENAIARRDFDEKQNAAREAKANLQAAEAALKLARLNLEYTRITAPIAGRVSRAEITVGNLVAPGNGPALTSLVSADRIYAAFDVDEQSYLKVVNGSQGKALPIHLGLADDEGYSLEGKLSSVDNRLDSSSGTIRLRALVDNPDGKLLPGLYARIRLGAASQREVLLIDEKAVGTDQARRFVLVVGEGNQTAYREVQLGSIQDGLRVVESGLKAGERIVVNGLQRVRPGDPVTPNVVPMGGAAPAAAKG
ncbi:efflux RND transporter periplasmic adaptor subunit [Quatrionicoccus australiensis]|uniref:efflux RND transporter periplasmic adaptor subunit n=1 Tax=Quatrionicoccus australiensis TaxID=138118 RepID=UPI001CFBD3AE|nr:efflux RND transporter periplasmic adaptor subunit [Quatrionicoccus australiensis]MCB4361600.1 efflux RND transporter periplasmic adaptor subunit [Quatrionicoccus australiensis]